MKPSSIVHRLILDSTDQGVLGLDREGRHVFVNPAACRMLGYAAEELVGAVSHAMWHCKRADGALYPAEECPIYRAIETGDLCHCDDVFWRKDGTSFPVEFTATPSLEKDQPIALVLLFRDITERKRTESNERLATEVLRVLNRNGDLDLLVGDVLRLIKDSLDFDAVGMRVRKGDDCPYYQHLGFSDDFVKEENSLCPKAENDATIRDADGRVILECGCGLVLSGRTDPRMPCFTEGGSFWTNASSELLVRPVCANPRNHCVHCGYQSVALVPLRSGDQIVGVLQLNDRRRGRFTPEMVRYLERIATSIGLAFHRKLAEEELKASEQRYRTYIDNSPAGVFVVDASGHYVEVNQAGCDILGYSEDELLERSIPDIMAREDIERSEIAFRTLKATGKGIQEEFAFVRKDGSTIYMSVSAVPATEDHYVAFCMDITEQKRAQDLQSQYAVALENQRQAMEELCSAADAANRAKSEFLANMSHEIRTPMTAILGYADILAGQLDDSQHREALGIIRRNGDHLLAIINDILDLSKIEAGKFHVQREACSLAALAVEVVSLMGVRAKDKGLGLTLQFAGPVPETVMTDAARLRQILLNLVGNAVKFTEAGEVRVVVSLTGRDGPEPKLVFDVVDTGIGMTAAQVGNLFRPFQQAETSTARRFGGTGLGLAISKRLAMFLGGDIAVRSELGRGSVFTLTVDPGPLTGATLVDHAGEAIARSAAAPRKADPLPCLDSHILLAEDGPDNQRFISFVLKKAGAKVTTVDNGRKAMEMALVGSGRRGMRYDDVHTPFDVILMDMQMPVMDGYEATRRLREEGYTSPIIALTAHAMADDRQKCLAAGCDDYATKPIDPIQLLNIIVAATHRGREPQAANS